MIIKTTKLPKETETEKGIKLLIKHFNEEAQKQKSSHRIVLHHGCYPNLSSKYCPFWFNPFSKQIHYWDEKFSFIHGLKKEDFDEIKPILEKIPEKFEIEIINEEDIENEI